MLVFHVTCRCDASDDADTILAPFRSWSLSDTALPTRTRDISAFYDESFDPDSIYMTGGQGCVSCIWKYNIRNDSISLEATVSITGWTSAGYGSSTFINGVLYWLGDSANLIKYNITSGENSLVASFNDVYYPCLTKHPIKNEIYIQGGSGSTYCENSTQFWVYDIDNNVTSQGPSLLNGRWGPTCIINDWLNINSGDSSRNDPYLYVFAGCSTYIERINVDKIFDNSNGYDGDWHQLTTLFNDETVGPSGSEFDFSTNFAYFGIFSYEQYIILMNGWDDYRYHENEMFLFDVSKLTIKYFGQFSLLAWATAPIYAQNRVFVFGGASTDEGWKDTIYISDEIIEPTLNPSQIPSLSPSLIPSTNPSKIPTNLPSIIPTLIPTQQPTEKPSKSPSKHPSASPSISPSLIPSVEPTITAETEIETTTMIITTRGTTSAATTSGTTDSEDGGASLNTNNNNSSGVFSGDSTASIVVITVGIVVIICCVIFACLFFISLRYYVNSEKELRIKRINDKLNTNINTNTNMNINMNTRQTELELQQKMPLKTTQVDSNVNDGIIINDDDMNGISGGAGGAGGPGDNEKFLNVNHKNFPLQLPAQPVESYSYMTNSNVSNGEGSIHDDDDDGDELCVENGNENDKDNIIKTDGEKDGENN